MKKFLIIHEDDPEYHEIIIPNPKFYGEGKKPYSQCKAMVRCGTDPKKSSVEIPDEVFAEPRESVLQIYSDNGVCKVDHDWSVKCMPTWKIHHDFLKDSLKEDEEELQKQSPDLVKLNRNSVLRRKMEKFSEKEMLEFAISNLDKRVQKGKPDKAVVRQKLQAKIAILASKEGS